MTESRIRSFEKYFFIFILADHVKLVACKSVRAWLMATLYFWAEKVGGECIWWC